MAETSYEDILDIVIETDIGTVTIRYYLQTLLTKLWEEAKGFNGKRPFGNGDWQFKVYEALIQHGVVDGDLDDDGFVERIDTLEADRVVAKLIKWVFQPRRAVLRTVI